jgi:hypothetical protein
MDNGGCGSTVCRGSRDRTALPRVRVQGYFNVWPAFAREVWESYPDEEHVYRPLPPSPQAIDRMMETMRWVQWLEVEQRHLVWMRAKQYGWRVICRRFGLRPHDGVATVATGIAGRC